MSRRRLTNSVHEATQTSPRLLVNPAAEISVDPDAWVDAFFEDNLNSVEVQSNIMADNQVDDTSSSRCSEDEEEDCPEELAEVEKARMALTTANEEVSTLPAAATVPTGTDANMAVMAQMWHSMQVQNARSKAQHAEAQLNNALAQLRSAKAQQRSDKVQRNLMAELENLRKRDNPVASSRGKAPVFDLEKDWESFATWKESWNYYIQDLDGMRDIKAKNRKKRAYLQQALSTFTLKWIGNQGYSVTNRENADFLIERLEFYIRGTTNPLVQITQLFGRKQSQSESVEAFVTDVKERAKLCEFDKVKDVANWFLMLCICCNIYHPDMSKKLMLEKNLTFERAIEICLEEEKALKTSKQLASNNRSSNPECGATSTYQQDRKVQQERGRSNDRLHRD